MSSKRKGNSTRARRFATLASNLYDDGDSTTTSGWFPSPNDAATMRGTAGSGSIANLCRDFHGFYPPPPPSPHPHLHNPHHPRFCAAPSPPYSMCTDSPLNRILQREVVGEWQVVGYLTTTNIDIVATRERTMRLFVQAVDRRRDRYNYGVSDANGVWLIVGETRAWMMDGDTVTVPGYANLYTVTLYDAHK